MGSIRIALDSDDLSVFGAPCDFILTYSDLVHDGVAFAAEHPGKQIEYIDRGMGDPGGKATIIDVETGAHTVASIPAWYDAKAAKHLPYLTYYCNRSTLPGVQAVIGSRHMWRWIATLDGTVAVHGFSPLQGPDLVQCTPAVHLGFHADLSLVLSPSWHPAPVSTHLGAAVLAAQNAGRDIAGAAAALAVIQANLHLL